MIFNLRKDFQLVFSTSTNDLSDKSTDKIMETGDIFCEKPVSL
jgi:hypothetical protein